MKWCVYLARCADGTLYCGSTTNVLRRIAEHNESPRGAKYTRSRRPVVLVATFARSCRSEALRLENQIKALSREEKERLLEGRT